MHQPEHAGEYRTVPSPERRLGPVAHDDVLDSRGDYGERNQELDERRGDPHRPGHRQRQGDRVAQRERRDDPEAVPPVASVIDRGQRQQEEDVIHRGQIGDVAEAEMDEDEELGHRFSYGARSESSAARASAGWKGCQ